MIRGARSARGAAAFPSADPAAVLLLALALLLSAGAAATAAEAPSLDRIEAEIAGGNTEKAARLVERALQESGPGARPALLYLRFKIHVLDLGPGGDKLSKKIAGRKLEDYAQFLDELEADVRAEGEKALPFLSQRLAGGDGLDRLLILGLFEAMAGERPDLAWTAGVADGLSPVRAAADAIAAAADGCGGFEAAEGAPPPEAVEAAWDREDYVQDAYAARSGLAFLAGVDAAAWGKAAAGTLRCRAAAGAVFDDLDRADGLGASLRDPLVASLGEPAADAARVDALALLGRVGDCGDAQALRGFLPRDASDLVLDARSVAIDRIRRRLGCDG